MLRSALVFALIFGVDAFVSRIPRSSLRLATAPLAAKSEAATSTDTLPHVVVVGGGW